MNDGCYQMLGAVVLLMMVMMVRGEEECPNLTDESRTHLKQLLVTQDVHDQMIGDFVEAWGPKVIQEADSGSCSRVSRSKVDDTTLKQNYFIRSTWLEGSGERNYTALLEKLDNGVYLIKLENGFALGKYYVLYAKNQVTAYYMCLFHQASESEKRKVLPWLSAVDVRKEQASSLPLPSDIQTSVDEAVSKIQTEALLLRDISSHTTFC